MKNSELVQYTLEYLAGEGIQNICICPGARNAPFIQALDKEDTFFKTITFYEEREAAFFTLQQIKQGKASAIITTSGTAVAELLPACIEAYYQKIPLVLISADRPKNFRGSGSPQAINQVKIMSNYANFYDLDSKEYKLPLNLAKDKPSHINVCFEEPLLTPDPELPRLDLQAKILNLSQDVEPQQDVLLDCKQPLIIVSGINSDEDRKIIVEKLNKAQAPIYLEALSNIQVADLKVPIFQHGEKIIHKLLKQKYFDVVIRIGEVPLASFWRRLDKLYQDIPVYSFSKQGLNGIARKSQVYRHYNFTFQHTLTYPNITNIISKFNQYIQNLYQSYPMAEQSFYQHLNTELNEYDNLYLGNSLPIRYWQHHSMTNKTLYIGANRGANGIDGQISSFVGFAKEKKRNVAVLGDLTFLYGISGLSLCHKFPDTIFQIIVINNRGGKIFQSMFESDTFNCQQDVDLQKIAEAYGFKYQLIDDYKNFKLPLSSHIIEVRPNNQESLDFQTKSKNYE